MSLPKFSTPIVGRAMELGVVCGALSEVRCVTIAGPGGIGKSRVAIEAARQAEQTLGLSAQLVSVDVTTPGGSLADRLALGLGLRTTAAQDARAALFTHLNASRALLLLDGIDASEPVGLLSDLLDGCLELRLLITCTTALGLPNERVVQLSALDVHSSQIGDTLRAAETIFVNAARSVQPSFSPDAETRDHIRALCKLCEGMPLAIELAAYWVPLIPVKFILSQLEGDLEWLTDARHLSHDSAPRSMQAVFGQFWKHLSPDERAGLARLAIFEDGFDADAARALAGMSDAFFARLVDGYFLRPLSANRFALHALMRRYLLTRLPDIEPDLRSFEGRFARLMLARGRALSALRTMARYPELEQQLTDDYANMRTALAHAARVKDAVLALELLTVIGPFWNMTGRAHETRDLCARAIKLDNDDLPPAFRAKAMVVYGNLSRGLGKFDNARLYLNRALALSTAVGAHAESSLAYMGLATIASHAGSYEQALEWIKQALALFPAGHDLRDRVTALSLAGFISYDLGRLAEAGAYFDEGLRLGQQLDDPSVLAVINNDRGLLNSALGNTTQAQKDIEEALRLNQLSGRAMHVTINLVNLGCLAYDLHDFDRAAVRLSESLSQAKRLGLSDLVSYSEIMLGRVYVAQGHVDAGQISLRKGMVSALERESRRNVITGLTGVGELLLVTHHFEQAFAIGSLLQHHTSLPAELLADCGRLCKNAAARLSANKIERLRALGAGLDVDVVARAYVETGDLARIVPDAEPMALTA